jgi:hypothetical protein
MNKSSLILELTLRFYKRRLSKVHGILQKLTNYAVLTEPLLGKKIKIK